MKRLLNMRISRWYTKLLFVIGALLISAVVAALLRELGSPMIASSVLNSLVTITMFLLGARLFRGKGEAVTPRRLWWRMTARPRLSRVLGILFGFGTLALLLSPILAPGSAISAQGEPFASTIIDSVGFAALAFLYLNSAFRLRKLPALVREPKFRTPVGLR